MGCGQIIENNHFSRCVCSDCFLMPEIIKIDFNMIIFECPIHGKKTLDIKTYFINSNRNNNKKCKCNCLAINITDYCKKCDRYFCDKCRNDHDTSHLETMINLKNLEEKECQEHKKVFKQYCKECNKQFCEECQINCQHNKKEIINHQQVQIDGAKNSMEYDERIIKLLKQMIESYEENKTNYFYNANMNYLIHNHKKENENENENEKILAKLRNIEEKIKNFFKKKFCVELNEDTSEVKINDQKIESSELDLFCTLELKNVIKISFKKTNLSNIDQMKEMSLPKLKEIDLSENLIVDINAFKEILEKNKEIRFINLSENKISKIDVFKDVFKGRKYKKLKFVNLEKNVDIIKKDLDEVKKLINKNNECTLKYQLNKGTNKDGEILLFGEHFLHDNKYKIKIIFKGETMDYENFKNTIKNIIISGENNEMETIEIKLLMTKYATDLKCIFDKCSTLISIEGMEDWNTCDFTNFSNFFNGCSLLTSIPDISNWDTSLVTDMSYMFYSCSSLGTLPDISKWDTSKVKDMQYMFSGCSKLKRLPNILKWNVSNVISKNGFTDNCEALENWNEINLF